MELRSTNFGNCSSWGKPGFRKPLATFRRPGADLGATRHAPAEQREAGEDADCAKCYRAQEVEK